MRPDLNKYLPMLDGMDLSREQKIDLIHDLWHIMESFVDRAFGIHPVQQVTKKNTHSDLQDSAKDIESINHQNKALLPPPVEGVHNHDTT